jgi:hypothetical protein
MVLSFPAYPPRGGYMPKLLINGWFWRGVFDLPHLVWLKCDGPMLAHRAFLIDLLL